MTGPEPQASPATTPVAPVEIESPATRFDTVWRTRFESLGAVPVSDSERAFYLESTFLRRDRFLKHLIADLDRQMERPAGKTPRCLDIGCNTGRYTRLLADSGFATHGVDFAASMIEEARSRHADIGFQQANAYVLPFEDGVFDASTSFGVLQCLADWRSAVREMLRILRPGGLGVIETNRAYSTVETLLRCASYVARGKMGFRAAREFFTTHAPAAANEAREDLQPRHYAVSTVVRTLRCMGAADISLHNPRRLPFYHDFESWGLTFSKPAPGTSSSPSRRKVTCAECRKW